MANKSAMKFPMCRYVVIINKNGEVSYYEDLAGGNGFTKAEHDGDAIKLLEYCYQFYDAKELDYMLHNFEEDFEEEAEEQIDKELAETKMYVAC